MGAFAYGYIVTQIPGGYLSEKFGGKWVFGIGTMINVILSLLSPFIVKYSKSLFIVTRIVQGLGQAGINCKYSRKKSIIFLTRSCSKS